MTTCSSRSRDSFSSSVQSDVSRARIAAAPSGFHALGRLAFAPDIQTCTRLPGIQVGSSIRMPRRRDVSPPAAVRPTVLWNRFTSLPLILHVSIRVTGGTIRFHFRKCFCLSSPNGLETPKRSADESASSVHPKEAAWPATEYLNRGSPKKRARPGGDENGVRATELFRRPKLRCGLSSG